MELAAAQRMALREMNKHGLVKAGWGFEFDNAKKRLGLTNFTKRKITISKYMVEYSTEEQVRQVILHEVAHAMLPVSAKHGAEWKATARRIGYTGSRLARNPYAEAQAQAAAKQRPARSSRTAAVTTAVAIANGSRVKLPNGQEAVIFKKAVKNYHARTADGTRWAIPFAMAPRLLVR